MEYKIQAVKLAKELCSGVYNSWVFCCITFIVFFRRNELKRLIIPEHSKNDVADFVHDGPDSNALFLVGAFTDVIIVNDWVYGAFFLSTFRLLMAIICRTRLVRRELRLAFYGLLCIFP